MTLRVAVQMDPIEAVNIAGDSTFALMMEAQHRGHHLSHYLAGSLSAEAGQGARQGAATARPPRARRSL